MPTVKNKIKLCETKLSDFSIEQIHGTPFYNRYSEIESVFRKYVPSVNFGQCFAQPCENKAKHLIEWYYVPGNEAPTRLSEIKYADNSAYEASVSQRDAIIDAIKQARNEANENAQLFLNAVLAGVGIADAEATTYTHNGSVLFGVWGMRAKQGRDLKAVVREDVLDHRVFIVNYQLTGEGSLSFSSVGRKYGHQLTTIDVPTVTPLDGWNFKKWEPGIPQGTIVTDDMTFTAVCEKEEVPVPPASPVPPIHDNEITKPVPPVDDDNVKVPLSPPTFNVHFRSEEGGILYGTIDYTKNKDESIKSSEVPTATPNEGYEFIGWNRQPEGFVVHEDTEFVARFRKKEKETKKRPRWFFPLGGGCLNTLLDWLLLALGLLLLFLFLWCFLFGKCHFDLCGCNCDEPEPRIITRNDSVPTPNPNPPLQNPCNTEQKAGGDEGYTGYFNMGQKGGKFKFDYNTINQPDRIVIYDGKGTSGKKLFEYEGGTETWTSDIVTFHEEYVTVTVEGLESGTAWYFNLNCPE